MSQTAAPTPSTTAAPRGVVLLEVLVALVLVATVGTVGVSLARDATRAVERVRAHETAMRRANALLEAIALWPRADLDRHLGARAEGDWTLQVERPSLTYYVVTLMERTELGAPIPDRSRVILATGLYRPEELTAP